MSEQTALTTTRTAGLLACGVVAGPLFLTVWLVQALTREGFDLTRHPLSLLSLGDLGWIQIAGFVVSGLLFMAFAGGLRRALYPGRVAAWGPALIAVNGIGLIMAGVFTTDAGAGFPPGAPAGAPPHVTWHGVLHEVGFLVASLSWIAACFALARRFTALGRRARAATCGAAPIAVLAVVAWPDLDSLSVRLVVGSAIQFAFTAALAVWMMRPSPPAAPTTTGATRIRR
ncbi:DUF998 domain-containing protein [Nonomuraea mangrovi]|uniref:DUF998 domain-containing protein n=1 Tax=Nonomuraea mangrovi TaxID=2316207 RepID=A0ABW4T6W1_9ACTN